MFQYNQWTYKLLSTIGVLIQLIIYDIPRDLIRWLSMKPKDVTDKVIVITGGGSGLGQRMAQILALRYHAKIAIIDVTEKNGTETAEGICTDGGVARFWKCDIRDVSALNSVAREIEDHFGPVDIVICNAAILYFAYFMELEQENLQRAVDVNLIGTINTIRAFLGEMEKRNNGQIVSICSIAGWAGETYGLAYCPTKFAVRGTMECLQMELRERGLHGIKCTTVCPYFARTPMILNNGMRPTSTWIPFMSTDSCSRRIIDAILKEKVMAFMPNYVHLIPMVKGFLSYHCSKSLRDYLNCRYEPSETTAVYKSDRKLVPMMSDYFRIPHFAWWILIVSGLLINFLAWYNPDLIDTPFLPLIGPFAAFVGREFPLFVVITNLFALIAHIGEAIYALAITDALRFSFACRFMWFSQTLILGFPSLSILRAYKTKEDKREQ